jgi:hypothetical protein
MLLHKIVESIYDVDLMKWSCCFGQVADYTAANRKKFPFDRFAEKCYCRTVMDFLGWSFVLTFISWIKTRLSQYTWRRKTTDANASSEPSQNVCSSDSSISASYKKRLHLLKMWSSKFLPWTLLNWISVLEVEDRLRIRHLSPKLFLLA